jgi:hemerythrin superfamily protein
VKQLFSGLTSAKGDSTETWEALVRLLAVHETAEEEILYPTVRSKGGDGAKAIVEQRLAEEDEAKKLLVEMEKLGPSGNGFGEKLAKLQQAVTAHAEAEEKEVLPLLKDVDEQMMHALATAYQAAKVLAPTHPHKMAPESAVANMAVGPVVAIVDRTRDLIRDVMRKAKN